MMERRTEESVSAFRRAVNLNPNSAAAHTNLSHIFAFAGQDREAIAHGEEAMRLSPLDPEMAFFLGGIAIAHYIAGRFSESARSATEALRLRPEFQGAQRLRAASLAQAGQIDAARASLATAQRQHPALSLDWIRASVPYQTPELMERFLDGMRKAGLKSRLGSEIHAVVDPNGLPVCLALSAGAAHGNRLAAKLLSHLKPGSMLLADRR